MSVSACSACYLAKKACDGKEREGGTCSRCTSRGVECVYVREKLHTWAKKPKKSPKAGESASVGSPSRPRSNHSTDASGESSSDGTDAGTKRHRLTKGTAASTGRPDVRAAVAAAASAHRRQVSAPMAISPPGGGAAAAAAAAAGSPASRKRPLEQPENNWLREAIRLRPAMHPTFLHHQPYAPHSESLPHVEDKSDVRWLPPYVLEPRSQPPLLGMLLGAAEEESLATTAAMAAAAVRATMAAAGGGGGGPAAAAGAFASAATSGPRSAPAPSHPAAGSPFQFDHTGGYYPYRPAQYYPAFAPEMAAAAAAGAGVPQPFLAQVQANYTAPGVTHTHFWKQFGRSADGRSPPGTAEAPAHAVPAAVRPRGPSAVAPAATAAVFRPAAEEPPAEAAATAAAARAPAAAMARAAAAAAATTGVAPTSGLLAPINLRAAARSTAAWEGRHGQEQHLPSLGEIFGSGSGRHLG
ncbi:unnamed protein product [Phaeothamnion confervicola]